MACLLVSDAPGLIIFDSKTSVDNNKNVIDPNVSATFPSGVASGVPWQHVVRYGVSNASAVYLGHGFLLTARHVGTFDTGLLIQGASYSRDTTFTPVHITIPGTPANAVVDLQLQKISGDPGLPQLAIAGSATSDLNKASVLVGHGKGKGTIIANQGWNWGDDSTRAFRWGTNTTDASTESLTYSVGSTPMNFLGIRTYFNSNKGADEATGTLGDSGSALFQSISGDWTLSGITVTVSQNGGTNTSSYDTNTFLPGDQNSDRTIFVRLREYSWVLRFDHWKTHYGIAPTTADTDDSDGDGVPLLVEYAMGLDPTQSSTTGLPEVSVEGTSMALTFNRLASATDIRLEVETSSTLASGSWTVEPATITVLDGTTVFQKVKATVSLGTGERKFARLKVSRL